MSSFTQNIRTAYELYLLGSKEKAFELLIPGTKHYYYLKIIDALKTERHVLSKDTLELIKHFKANFSDLDTKRIDLQSLFLRYDGAKTDQERKEILDELKANYLYLYFEYPKPADVLRKTHNEEEKSKAEPVGFEEDRFFNEEQVIKEIEQYPGRSNSIHAIFYNKIDYTKLTEDDFWQFITIPTSYASFTTESFWNKMVDTLTQKFQRDYSFQIPYYLYDRFTLDKLEELGEKIPQIVEDSNYIGKIFEKKFHFELDSENEDTFTLDERREQLIRMYEASKDRPQSLKSALLLEILENGIKQDIFDKGYFIEYLKNPLKNWHINKTYQKERELYDHNWNNYIHPINNRSGGIMDKSMDKKLYKRYLEQFYAEAGDLTEFKQYFDQDFLKSLLEEFEFLSGKQLTKEKTDLTHFEKLSNQVMIDLLECNKSVFQKEDRVKLVATIKNVSTLHIKIFEFNSENYYRKNLAPFRTDVDLDGLVTAYEESHQFEEPPQKKFRKVFEFPDLDDKLGLFVIEFISNGYSSRAVIKKGSLSLIYKSTVAGQIAYILDSKKEI